MITSDERWYFSKEQLENSPSRRLGITADQELNYKQLAANLIYDMGSRKHLSVNQLCISTAIVYMHRFYVFHSFTHFQWHTIAMASLFLAAKVEEQTRKLEHVIKSAQWCLQKSRANVNCASESYLDQVQELVINENILLQTLGFDVNVKHPHTFVVEFCEKIKVNKDITKTMYGMASNSLNVTTMCVQYKPSVVACFCIHFICKWSGHEINMKEEDQTWWSCIDKNVTEELLDQMNAEFLQAWDKSPQILQSKIQEYLKCKNIPRHIADHKLDTGGQSSSDSFCNSSASTSLSSSFTTTFASSSMFQVPKHGETSMGNRNSQGASRMHRPSTNYLASHHQSSHPASNAPSWSAIINGGINTFTNTSAPAAHVPSQQQQQQRPHHHQQHRYSQHQHNYHHRNHAPGQTFSSSKNTHKSILSNPIRDVPKPKIPTMSHSTNSGHNYAKTILSDPIHDLPKPKIPTMSHSVSSGDNNTMPMKQVMKPDQRTMNEMPKKSGLAVKHEPDRRFTIAPVGSISKLPDGAVLSNSHPKVYFPSGSVTSNITQGVSLAKSSDQRTEVKTEPCENRANRYAAPDTVDSSTYNVRLAKPSRSHSIFSPSPIRDEPSVPFELPIKQEAPLVEQRINLEPLVDVRIKQEPSRSIFSNKPDPPVDVRIKQDSSRSISSNKPDPPVDVRIKQEPSRTIFSNKPEPPVDVRIKQEPSRTIFSNKLEPAVDVRIKQEPSRTILSHKPDLIGAPFSDLARNMEKVETVGDYENIFRTTVSSSAYANEPPVCTPIITNVVTLAPLLNSESIRKEPSRVEPEPCAYSEIPSTSKLPLPPKAVLDDRIAIALAGGCISESQRKMKKDKHHKEKKRHKDDRHRHHKEHRSKEEQHLKKPEPIKITIPKEKLTHIPESLKLKFSTDRMVVTPSTSSKDVRLNISQNVSKSLKRKRESDHGLSSGMPHPYNSSQNGFNDCL